MPIPYRILQISIYGSLFAFIGCEPDIETVPLPTKICVQVKHHTWNIPDAKVYIKYNSDTFPGYDKGPAFFDAVFVVGKDAKGCLEPIPVGRHWLVARGYDSLYTPHNVFGSLRVDISLDKKPKVDTILYVSE